jgi:hypothetical protein
VKRRTTPSADPPYELKWQFTVLFIRQVIRHFVVFFRLWLVIRLNKAEVDGTWPVDDFIFFDAKLRGRFFTFEGGQLLVFSTRCLKISRTTISEMTTRTGPSLNCFI